MKNNTTDELTYYKKRIRFEHNIKKAISNEKIEQLMKIETLLKKHISMRATAKKLNEMIADTEEKLNVLLIGDINANKSLFINALLNQAIMPAEYYGLSYINTIIRYGEEEKVTAYFYDGQIADFSIDQISLFSISDTFSSQMMREGLDYLEIEVNHELLKKVTFFDTPAYRKSIFIKENFLARCQATMWVTTMPIRGIPSEILTAKTLDHTNNKLLFVLDEHEQLTLQKESNAVFNKFEQAIVSTPKMLQAHETNSEELYEQSNIEALFSFLDACKLSTDEFHNLVNQRFFEWLEKLVVELDMLINRDPYLEAFTILEEFKSEQLELLETAKNNEEIKRYKEQFQALTEQFNELQTSYQFIKFLDKYELNKSETTQQFIALNEKYTALVYAYRKKFKVISEEQVAAWKNLEKMEGKLNELYEQVKIEAFSGIQKWLIKLESQMLDVHTNAEYRIVRLEKAYKRLQAFKTIVEAKAEILSFLRTMQESRAKDLKNQLENVKIEYDEIAQYYLAKKEQLIVEECSLNNELISKEVLHNLQIKLDY